MKLFLQYNWASCIMIRQSDAFGSNDAQAITNTFLNYGLQVTNVLISYIKTFQIQDNVKPQLKRRSIRIVVISSSHVSLTSFDSIFHSKLIGMSIVEPINTTLLTNSAYEIWKEYEPK
ncbi:hypothetical protein I4U23_022824 [Adineta vaga]|nr:hypothetical protein I4U23_022824 [Adineta vaga]